MPRGVLAVSSREMHGEKGDSSSGSDNDADNDTSSDEHESSAETAPLIAPTMSKSPLAESHLATGAAAAGAARTALAREASNLHIAAARSKKEDDSGLRLWGAARRSQQGNIVVTVLLYVRATTHKSRRAMPIVDV